MTPVPSTVAPRRRADRTTKLAFLAVSIVFSIFFIMPIVWSFANSFKPAAEALAHPVALFPRLFRWRTIAVSNTSAPAGMSTLSTPSPSPSARWC